MRDAADLERELGKIGDALDAACRFHLAKDESNAALHMAAARPAPLTVRLQNAAADMQRLREELAE